MKQLTIAIAVSAGLLFTVAFAQDEHELEGVMKTINGVNGDVRKGVAEKDEAATVAAATKLAQSFQKVQEHFEEHHMEDGIGFAKTARSTALDISTVAKAGDWAKATDDLKTLGGACGSCHAAHRERLPDGTFKMK